MDKQIFISEIEENYRQKINNAEEYHPKQEFIGENFEEDENNNFNEDEQLPLEGELLEEILQKTISPSRTSWKNILILTALLFLFAIVAQSIQWLWDTFQNKQWIYFAFATVSFIVVILGISEIITEWRRLIKLKKRLLLQQQSRQIYLQADKRDSQPIAENSRQETILLCLSIAEQLHIDTENPTLKLWQSQINESYKNNEITYLFSQQILQPFDNFAKKYVIKMSAEASIIVAISPLAIVDMFFIAWRNLRLINKIAQIYGIELGYFTRIRLLRMVLVNIAFAGATEFVQDIGMDWLSQDITAKVSSRIAQGIGVGLLTARLGIKAMEFCRPLAFQQREKPSLGEIQKNLLNSIKQTVFTRNQKLKEKV